MLNNFDGLRREGAGVDVFTERDFVGRKFCFRVPKAGRLIISEGQQLLAFGSIIVGSRTVVRVRRRGKGRSNELPPRTIVADLARMVPGNQKLVLSVEGDGA